MATFAKVGKRYQFIARKVIKQSLSVKIKHKKDKKGHMEATKLKETGYHCNNIKY